MGGNFPGGNYSGVSLRGQRPVGGNCLGGNFMAAVRSEEISVYPKLCIKYERTYY